MEQTTTTIAVIGTHPKVRSLRCFFSCPFIKHYTYMEQHYRFIRLPFSLSPSQLPDVILVVCPLSPSRLSPSLEEGLTLLAQVIRLPVVRESQIPVVLLFTAQKPSFFQHCPVDFDLLEDVLQIPVLPCPCTSCGADDGKAAIAYARNLRISYDCLDFSPEKLAREALSRQELCQPCSGPIRIFLRPASALALIFLLLFFLLWLTLTGALYLSRLPLHPFPWHGEPFTFKTVFFSSFFWMIQVLLPLALLFLPFLFLLDEIGLLPRAAFLADRIFSFLGGCGEQCITMAAGLGCHAAGIRECRRIPAARERFTAILTIPLLPCWGRFPVFAALTTLFAAAKGGSSLSGFRTHPSSFLAALCLTALILTGTAASLCLTGILSHTVFASLPSAFFLELPPVGWPKKNAVLAKAWNRTCFILGKTAAWTAAVSLVIWLLALLPGSGPSLLNRLNRLLDPPGRFLGLDGVILSAFLLTTPANEILLPVTAMLYLIQNGLPPAGFFQELYPLFLENGWTWHTALSVIVLTLFHWPCLTTLQAVYQETRSLRWTLAAALIPTLPGIGICLLLRLF